MRFMYEMYMFKKSLHTTGEQNRIQHGYEASVHAFFVSCDWNLLAFARFYSYNYKLTVLNLYAYCMKLDYVEYRVRSTQFVTPLFFQIISIIHSFFFAMIKKSKICYSR